MGAYPTQARLRELLHFDESTGFFMWRQMRAGWPAGAPAGSKSGGYTMVCVDDIVYPAHRLAWVYVYGACPSGQVDHINGNRADNRIENLREVSPAENSHNRKGANRNSRSGLLGVQIDSSHPKKPFRAVIRADGRRYYLGRYGTPEEAHAVYLAAKVEKHPGYVA